jgi:phosphonate transport system substrate-binding protein
MTTRRMALALMAATTLVASAASVSAQSWKEKFPELVFAVIPAENAAGVTERYGPMMAYLTKELGTNVKLRIAQDYAAVIEGQRAGQIHVAQYGPSSFARALATGAKIDAFAIEINADGSRGYYSVLYTRKDNPATKIEDLKGKNLCLVDPNSTSGNNVPRFAMAKMGIDPEAYFGKVVYAGSHENAIIAVQQGTCDAAFNWWNDESESNLQRMVRKNMVKGDDFKLIFKSDQIVNSPTAVLADLPADLKKAIVEAVLAMPTKDKAAFEKIYEGKQLPWQPVDNKAYDSIIQLNTFVDDLRKKRS